MSGSGPGGTGPAGRGREDEGDRSEGGLPRSPVIGAALEGRAGPSLALFVVFGLFSAGGFGGIRAVTTGAPAAARCVGLEIPVQ